MHGGTETFYKIRMQWTSPVTIAEICKIDDDDDDVEQANARVKDRGMREWTAE